MFNACYYLEKATLPDSVTSFGENVFYYCNNLESVNLPSKLTSTGECTFGKCTALTTVALPDTLTELSRNMFWASGLESIELPVNLKKNWNQRILRL